MPLVLEHLAWEEAKSWGLTPQERDALALGRENGVLELVLVEAEMIDAKSGQVFRCSALEEE